MRYHTDALDVQVVAKGAKTCATKHSMQSALLGLVIAAHYNCLRTFGMVQTSITQEVNWAMLHAQLKRCGELWGNLEAKRPHRAIYSPDCMPGSGLPSVEGDYYQRFVAHFRAVQTHSAVAQVAALLATRICTLQQYL